MTAPSYLGLDLGTSGLRALLVDETGTPLAEAGADYPTIRPFPGASEQDPNDWTAALDRAAAALAAERPASWRALRAIGVSGQMHGATLLDRDGAVIRPCILWNDGRSALEARALDGMTEVRALGANIVFAGFTAPKLLWLERHEPEAFARCAKVLLPAGFLNHHLTGEAFADLSDSAGTAWLDVARRRWSPELLEAGHMRLEQMPTVLEGTEVGGTLRPVLAERWGVSSTVAVVAGAGDNAAAACGVGALEDGESFVSLGTSGVVLAARRACAPAPETAVHTFCHALPARWYQMGVILAATDCLNWLARLTGKTPQALSASLGATAQAPGPVRFYPYLSGERTPYNDAALRGAFAGLSAASDDASLARAVMEGVALALRDVQDALEAAGAPAGPLYGVGGGMASPFWRSALATALDRPILLPDAGAMGAAMGAARLAIIGATGGAVEDVIAKPGVARVVEPEAALRDAYDEASQRHRAAYRAIMTIQ